MSSSASSNERKDRSTVACSIKSWIDAKSLEGRSDKTLQYYEDTANRLARFLDRDPKDANLSIRGINANVLLIDSLTRRCKSAYLVINEKNDMFAFSDVIELPKTDECKSLFGISEWVEKW